MAELADAHGSGPCESNFMQVQVLLPAPYFKGVPLGTPLKYFYTSKQVTGLEGERLENSPADCFPRESYAKLELITRRSKRGRRFRNNKGMLPAPV